MSVLGQGMQLAAGNLEAITPGLIAVFVGVLLVCLVFVYDAINHD